MKRRILFVVFAEDECRQTHALKWALELARAGHEIRVVLEGGCTQVLRQLDMPGSHLGALVRQAHEAGLIAGACRAASIGCGCDATTSPALQAAQAIGSPLLSGMDGHVSLTPFVQDCWEIVVV